MIPLITSLRHQDDATRISSPSAAWRVVPSEPAELRFVFPHSILKYADVRALFDWLLSEPSPTWQVISLDFSLVRDILAPWAPVFAHLEYVTGQTQIRCRLLGMNERLTNMAAFAMVATVASGSASTVDDLDELCELGRC